MATQTETFKFTKPSRTDNINIDDLNGNFDIMEAELKKRPTNEDVAALSAYNVDLTAWVTVDLTSESNMTVDLTEHVDGADLLTRINAGQTPRIKFLNADGTPHTAALDSKSVHQTDAGTRTVCSCTVANTYYGTYGTYSLNITSNEGTYTVYLDVFPFSTGAGTVKTVNGVPPDPAGNVEVTVSAVEPATTSLNFDNWFADENAYYRETLDDGSSITHAIARDTAGSIVSIGGITIEGVS